MGERMRLCRRCMKFYDRSGSRYCTVCLATHPDWSTLGCGYLGCTLSHEETTQPEEPTDA